MASKSDGDLTKTTSGFGVETENSPGADKSDTKKAGSKTAPKLGSKAKKAPKQKKSRQQRVDPSAGIPKAVSRRMYQRVGIFSGIPTLLAFATIPGSYFVTEQGWIDFPSTVVLFVSVTFLGLGLLGVSYGIISASWDEEIPGSILGTSEFQLNLGRIQERRQEQKKLRKLAQEKQGEAAAKKSDKTKKSDQSQKAEAEVTSMPSALSTEAAPESQDP
ncbi:MAG: DUF3464 family protein [Acaryochloridaceae cyanobacterium CSU_5_19]|nr:DUF3464 family protein [Acaryochloridaceae cyanobacterium CSU_5_19]